jgi:hypothetical protein
LDTETDRDLLEVNETERDMVGLAETERDLVSLAETVDEIVCNILLVIDDEAEIDLDTEFDDVTD